MNARKQRRQALEMVVKEIVIFVVVSDALG